MTSEMTLLLTVLRETTVEVFRTLVVSIVLLLKLSSLTINVVFIIF